MKRIMNICTYDGDMERYRDRADLQEYLRRYRLDGLEVLEGGDPDVKGLIVPEDVIGVHLRFFPCWYCMWSGDTATLLEEFGTWEEVRYQLGGTDREGILRIFRDNLAFARKYHPQYVVFHVSDVLLAEAVPRKFRYSDEEIVDAAAEVLNILFEKDEGFELLLENLWWPGFTMARPKITERLLSKVRYPRTGVMLDIGHLLNTNTSLRTLEEGADYIREVLLRHTDRSIVRGLHFHQTLSGAYVEEQKKCPPKLTGTYAEKTGALTEYIHRVDRHQPFVGRIAEELVEWIAPEYLVYELISSSREEHEKYLREINHF